MPPDKKEVSTFYLSHLTDIFTAAQPSSFEVLNVIAVSVSHVHDWNKSCLNFLVPYKSMP